jgi:hypothetical protein
MKAISIRPLVLMGQSSLQVFCTHFVFCFIGIAMMGDAQRLYGWKQAALLLTTFGTLYLVVRLRERHLEASPGGAGSQGTPTGSSRSGIMKAKLAARNAMQRSGRPAWRAAPEHSKR